MFINRVNRCRLMFRIIILLIMNRDALLQELDSEQVASKDYYGILGVQRNATEREIKVAYRELAKQWHPDKNPDVKLASSRFAEISEAYEVLRSVEHRQQYDEIIGSTGVKPQNSENSFHRYNSFWRNGDDDAYESHDPFTIYNDWYNHLSHDYGRFFSYQTYDRNFPDSTRYFTRDKYPYYDRNKLYEDFHQPDTRIPRFYRLSLQSGEFLSIGEQIVSPNNLYYVTLGNDCIIRVNSRDMVDSVWESVTEYPIKSCHMILERNGNLVVMKGFEPSWHKEVIWSSKSSNYMIYGRSSHMASLTNDGNLVVMSVDDNSFVESCLWASYGCPGRSKFRLYAFLSQLKITAEKIFSNIKDHKENFKHNHNKIIAKGIFHLEKGLNIMKMKGTEAWRKMRKSFAHSEPNDIY